jgi:hypothetical protein
MTRKEAIKWLNRLYIRADITDEYGDMEDMQPYEEAINIAINALKVDEMYNLEYENADEFISKRVLEDIRYEIDGIYIGYRHGYEVMADVLAVLDKHIIESEE